MVYIINAQDCQAGGFNLAAIRNRLFTAITRSKAWVRVLGIGSGMKALSREYEQLKQREFELRFRYPTAEERERLSIVHRDMSAGDRKRLKAQQKQLKDLFRDLEAGNVHLEDLDEEVLTKLEDLLRRKGESL